MKLIKIYIFTMHRPQNKELNEQKTIKLRKTKCKIIAGQSINRASFVCMIIYFYNVQTNC